MTIMSYLIYCANPNLIDQKIMSVQQRIGHQDVSPAKQRKRSVFHTINQLLITTIVVIAMTLMSFAFYQNHLPQVALILALHTLFMVWLLLAVTDLNYQAYSLYPLLLLLLVFDDFPIALQLTIIAALTLVWCKAMRYVLGTLKFIDRKV